ncbi:MAG: LCP family protein [Candidatus Nanopelagicaceae bacterium]|nr:LCP family protein [Candidatus Nanopelagicaceae bacterium]
MLTPRLAKLVTSASLGIVFASLLSWVGLNGVVGSISRNDVFGGLKTRAVKESKALNFLVVGSDSRSGLSKIELRKLRVGSTRTAAGGRSDTMFLVHISKDRSNAVIVSIPRDTLATIPSHIDNSGKLVPGAVRSKINAAFAWGGAPLLIQTLESKSKLHIDHYVEINFSGFTKIVDSLGGIEVCSKTAINDPKSHLVMSSGKHTLMGLQALAYVRTREFDGTGDIGRMKRQQAFVSSVFHKVTSAGILLNPAALIKVFNASMGSITTDPGLGSNDLLSLLQNLGNLSASKVRTLTVPLSNSNGYAPGIGSVVIWDPVQAPLLFDRLNKDHVIFDMAAPSPSTSSSKPSKSRKSRLIEKFNAKVVSSNLCAAKK